MNETLEILVRKANEGDKTALEAVILNVKDYVYNLSLKMLLYPEDAEDATQEILIKIITHLSSYQENSKFTTWVYRVATNYLLNHQGRKTKAFTMPFEAYAQLIDRGHSEEIGYTTNAGEQSLLEEEVKVSCTQGLLLCLAPLDRMVYILSEILEFNGVEGAEITGLTAANFRKKLSRSRAKIRHFLSQKCGLANPKNPCRCHKKVDFLIEEQIIHPTALRFAPITQRSIDLIEELGELEKSIAIYRSVPKLQAPEKIYNELKQVLKIN